MLAFPRPFYFKIASFCLVSTSHIKNNYNLKEAAPKSSNHLGARPLIFQNMFDLLKIISQQSLLLRKGEDFPHSSSPIEMR